MANGAATCAPTMGAAQLICHAESLLAEAKIQMRAHDNQIRELAQKLRGKLALLKEKEKKDALEEASNIPVRAPLNRETSFGAVRVARV